MSRLQDAVKNDLKLLALARDEIGLQSHLFSMEVKERWAQLEGQWAELQGHVAQAESAASGAAGEANAAMGLLMNSLRDGYAKVREALKS